MTVTYSYTVSTSRFAGFFKLMLRWRGSAYKLLYADFAIFGFVYTLLSVIYRLALNSSHREQFEHIVLYCDKVTALIPIDFVLGFYISVVVGKWQEQFNAIPWPDQLSTFVTSYIDGDSTSAKRFRRTIVRYCILSLVLCLRSISSQVKKRFPEEEHLINAGLLTRSEQQKFDEYKHLLLDNGKQEQQQLLQDTGLYNGDTKVEHSNASSKHNTSAKTARQPWYAGDSKKSGPLNQGKEFPQKTTEDLEAKPVETNQDSSTTNYDISRLYFVPLTWAATMIQNAKERRDFALTDYSTKLLVDAIVNFRGQLGVLFAYDWVCIPLAYTQVVTIAVYAYFTLCLMGRQFIDQSKNYRNYESDIYVPVFTVLQFIFYVGWLKVGESLLNPFGEDDDDFETNWMIDRNINVAYMIVDTLHNDVGGDLGHQETSLFLNYPKAAERFKRSDAMKGSALSLTLPKQLAAPVNKNFATNIRRKAPTDNTSESAETYGLPPVLERNERSGTRMQNSDKIEKISVPV